QNLRRILNVLGDIVGEATLGDRIVQNRPVGGYAALSDLIPALGSEASYLKVRDFLTVYAWVDREEVADLEVGRFAAERGNEVAQRGVAADGPVLHDAVAQGRFAHDIAEDVQDPSQVL